MTHHSLELIKFKLPVILIQPAFSTLFEWNIIELSIVAKFHASKQLSKIHLKAKIQNYCLEPKELPTKCNWYPENNNTGWNVLPQCKKMAIFHLHFCNWRKKFFFDLFMESWIFDPIIAWSIFSFFNSYWLFWTCVVRSFKLNSSITIYEHENYTLWL